MTLDKIYSAIPRHLLRFLDPGREYGEKELDALLEEISVPDYCFVRREMIAFGMLARRKNPDGGADLYRVTDGDAGKGT